MAKIIYETEESPQEVAEVSGPLKVKQSEETIKHEALDELQDLYVSIREQLDPKLDELKIAQAQLAEVNEQFQAALDDAYPEDQKGIRATANTTVMFSAKGAATEVVDKQALIKILGIDLFIELANIKISDLDKYLTEKQKATVAKKVHKNKRTIKWTNKGANDMLGKVG